MYRNVDPLIPLELNGDLRRAGFSPAVDIFVLDRVGNFCETRKGRKMQSLVNKLQARIHRDESGITLIEVLVTVGIIVALTAVVVPIVN